MYIYSKGRQSYIYIISLYTQLTLLLCWLSDMYNVIFKGHLKKSRETALKSKSKGHNQYMGDVFPQNFNLKICKIWQQILKCISKYSC